MPSECPVQDKAELEALLAGRLKGERAAELRDHLDQDCEHCLSLLDKMGIEDMLSAAMTDHVAEADADRVFDAVMRRLNSGGVPDTPVSEMPRRARRIGIWAAAALPVAAAAVLVMNYGLKPDSTEPNTLEKGIAAQGNAVHASLDVFRMARGKVERLEKGASLAKGQSIVFRVYLDAPARIYLVGVRGKEAKLLYDSEVVVPAGDRELSSKGNVLGLEPASVFGGKGRLTVVLLAAPKGLSDPVAKAVETASGGAGCDDCSYSTFSLTME